MTLTIHHLHRSQSERVVWLCEELNIPYKLETYDRDPTTLSAPAQYRNLHWTGTAPIITDGPITLAETGAIFEYLLTKYGHGKLALPPTHPQYPDYLFWLHNANGSLMPGLLQLMFSRMNSPTSPTEDMGAQVFQKRVDANFQGMDAQLAQYPYLAGEELTAADCMVLFSLTTFRTFSPFSLEAYPNIVRYLERVSRRAGYKSAMAKAEPGMEPVVSAAVPKSIFG
ncbi:glutathione S-transferase [Penicillium nucicola]|uniref:glutathione S-transferase n=1 Tax=Penicillium nucicola TaxID=1850975 RepID=UPI002545B654|nr:glutathione S-transferase [Penicillium nucicola]KAJ5770703.1 glutathione S-transferase [Penicillium nucicola]